MSTARGDVAPRAAEESGLESCPERALAIVREGGAPIAANLKDKCVAVALGRFDRFESPTGGSRLVRAALRSALRRGNETWRSAFRPQTGGPINAFFSKACVATAKPLVARPLQSYRLSAPSAPGREPVLGGE